MAEKGPCKWCEQGECWTHGQIAKPAGYKGGGKGKGGGKRKGGGGSGGGKGDGKKGKMKAMFSMMMQSYGMGDGGYGGESGGSANVKGDLATAYSRSLKGTGQEKGEVVYETSEVEGKQKAYQSVVTIAGNSYTGEVVPGKKGAEHSAAGVALADMFPDESGGGWGGASQMAWGGGGDGGDGGDSGRGKKRKHEEGVAQPVPPKSRLVHALHLILGRPNTAADTVWTVEAAGGKHIGSVTLTQMDKTFSGEPSDSRKAAENSAAEAALAALADQLAPLEEEHKAKKTQRNAENLEKLKKRTEEKKAEKAAAKAAKEA